MWVLKILIIISGLIYLYSQCEEEEYVGLKLIGYYLLGGFLFRFNEFPVPMGFLIFVIFFRPTINKVAKTRATYLGLMMLFISIISPMVSNYIFERPVEVVASSTNLYTLDTIKDLNSIKEKIEYQSTLKTDDLRIDYEEDGEIRELRYNLIGDLGNHTVLYQVSLLTERQVYSIRPKKIDQWITHGNLISADRFFEVLSEINFEDIVKHQLDWYVVESSGQYTTSSENITHFQYIHGVMTPVDDSMSTISGYYITNYGMKKTEETPTSIFHIGTHYVKYWFQRW